MDFFFSLDILKPDHLSTGLIFTIQILDAFESPLDIKKYDNASCFLTIQMISVQVLSFQRQ